MAFGYTITPTENHRKFLKFIIDYKYAGLSDYHRLAVKNTIRDNGYFPNGKVQSSLNTIRDWHLHEYVEYIHKKNNDEAHNTMV